MGNALSWVISAIFGDKEARILILGLDNGMCAMQESSRRVARFRLAKLPANICLSYGLLLREWMVL